MAMRLAERVQVRKTPALSLLCHRAKNLYNLANFYVRQEIFHLESVLTYFALDFMLRKQQAYQALNVIKLVNVNNRTIQKKIHFKTLV